MPISTKESFVADTLLAIAKLRKLGKQDLLVNPFFLTPERLPHVLDECTRLEMSLVFDKRGNAKLVW